MVIRCNGQGAHEKRADASALIGVPDNEGHLGDRRVGLVANEARVGYDGTVETVGHHPDEVVGVVDLEQVSHQRLGGVSRGLEAAVQRLAGELDGAVRGALIVAG